MSGGAETMHSGADLIVSGREITVSESLDTVEERPMPRIEIQGAGLYYEEHGSGPGHWASAMVSGSELATLEADGFTVWQVRRRSARTKAK